MELLPGETRITLAFKQRFPLREDLLGTALKSLEFTQGAEMVLRVRQGGAQATPSFVWSRDNCAVYYDQALGWISVEGAEAQPVTAGFKELLPKLNEVAGGDVEGLLRWAEVAFSGRVEETASFLDSEITQEATPLARKLSGLLGKELRCFSRAYFWTPEPKEATAITERSEWMFVSIEPFVPNPRYRLLRLLYRSTSLAEVDRFSGSLPSLAAQVMAAFG